MQKKTKINRFLKTQTREISQMMIESKQNILLNEIINLMETKSSIVKIKF